MFKYDNAIKYVKNKDTSINSFMLQSLNKTQKIFRYENLPDSVPYTELERILQTQGKAIFTKVNNDYYVLENGNFSGKVDVYNRPTEYTVSNVALNLTKTFTIDDECVLMKNDYYMTGILPILYKFGALMVDSEISLNTASILSRINMLISAPDDKTKASAELFINRIMNGDISVIGDNCFFDGIKLQTAPTQSNYISQLIELQQYYKASFLNEIGLNANFNMKRERLTANEIALNVDNLLPLIDDMLSERKSFVDKINEMYGLDIKVDLTSVWKTTHEHADRELVTIDTISKDDKEELTTDNDDSDDNDSEDVDVSDDDSDDNDSEDVDISDNDSDVDNDSEDVDVSDNDSDDDNDSEDEKEVNKDDS